MSSICDELAGDAGEHFGDVERLGEEALDLAGAADGQLILFRKLVHAEDGDDVLQRLVLLQRLLDAAGGLVMLLADDCAAVSTRLVESSGSTAG